MFDRLLVELRKLVKTDMDEDELAREALVERVQLLIAPIWYGTIHNSLLDRSQQLGFGGLFEANLNLLF
jgi:hypothetical protein